MIRRALTTIALASAAVVLLPGVAVADNCSGLQDCYGSAGSAAGAAAGMALVIGLAVLAAPALLRGARPESRPDSADHKQPSRAPLNLTLKHGDLMPQEQDLGVLGAVGAGEQGQPAEHPPSAAR